MLIETWDLLDCRQSGRVSPLTVVGRSLSDGDRQHATHTGQPVFSKAAVRTGANYLLGPAPPLLL